MSWKPEVIADETGKWYGNALRFTTKEEAEASARELAMRWFAVRDWRASECDDPVTHSWCPQEGLRHLGAANRWQHKQRKLT